MPLADICRKAGISQATYFNWKKKYDGLLPTEMRRLKQLEDENAKLKRIVADLSLDKEMLQDALRQAEAVDGQHLVEPFEDAAATPGASWSNRRARLRNSRSALSASSSSQACRSARRTDACSGLGSRSITLRAL